MRELDTVSPVVWPAWCYSGEGQSETDSAGATEIQQAPSAAATTAKPRRRRGGAGTAAAGRGDLAPSGSVKAERLSPSSGGGSSRGSVSPGGGAATPSSSSAASTYPGTPPGERGSPSGTAPPPPPSLPSPHPPPLQHTPALKQMEQMMTRNYSDFMRSLAAKYNNSNPNDYFSAPRNGFLSGLDTRYTPFKPSSGGAFPGLAPIPTTAARGASATPPTPPPSTHHASSSSATASASKDSSAQDRGVPQYNLYSASATFPANAAAFQHPLIDMSSTQALISMVRSASAQSASQLETYLKGAAGAFKRPAPSPADPTASTSSAVAAAAAAASSSSPLDLSSSSSSSTASSSTASTSSAASNNSASCSLAMASMLAAAAAASASKKARTSEPIGKFLLGSPLLPHAPLLKGDVTLEETLTRKDARKGASSVSPRPRGPARTLPTPPPPVAVSTHLPPPPPPPPPQTHHRAPAALSGASPCMSLCTDASKPCSGSQEGSDPRELVARWSVEDVCAFVSSIDICAEYAAVFRDQRIDGSALPLLTEEHLTSSLAMKLGPALKLRAALARRLGHCAVCLHCVHCHGTPAPQPSLAQPALPAAAPKPPTPATTPSPAPTPPAAAPAPSAPSPAASPAPAAASPTTSAAGGRSPPAGEVQ
ncbi:flocculation protein FLO11-like isoform X2 [Ischnura elegans]|uniref:flocculation protein FLO11-like isoform X2 n=1 Tax=Ischnura elegans TaxID=197161 RepID=UPI001ED88A06|nr:flocculation protein FLO11-like isoform X2 [Ischnura elegans]